MLLPPSVPPSDVCLATMPLPSPPDDDRPTIPSSTPSNSSSSDESSSPKSTPLLSGLTGVVTAPESASASASIPPFITFFPPPASSAVAPSLSQTAGCVFGSSSEASLPSSLSSPKRAVLDAMSTSFLW